MLGSLGKGILFTLVSVPFELVCLVFVARGLIAAEATKIERARSAGEAILAS